MKEKFIRFRATDGIELCGILYSPNEESIKTVIHVHGLAGNFYENRFVSNLAQMYTSKGYNFLTFNNRGTGYFSDLLKQGDPAAFVKGGGAYEKFEECIYDIDGIIKYVRESGTKEIILQGHSYGCNKVVYYYNQVPSDDISRIILLAPCDIVEEIKVFFGENYNNCLDQAKKLIENDEGQEVIDSPLFPLTFSSDTFMTDWQRNSKADIFRYSVDNFVHEELNSINIPVLIEIGNKDNCVFVVDKEKVDYFFENTLKNAVFKINYIEDAPHNYLNSETKLADDIAKWL